MTRAVLVQLHQGDSETLSTTLQAKLPRAAGPNRGSPGATHGWWFFSSLCFLMGLTHLDIRLSLLCLLVGFTHMESRLTFTFGSCFGSSAFLLVDVCVMLSNLGQSLTSVSHRCVSSHCPIPTRLTH